MNKQLNGSLRVILAASIWGAAYPLTKAVISDIPPVTLGFLRFAAATLFFVIWEKSLPFSGIAREDRKDFIKLGFWGVFVLVLGIHLGLEWAPGICASICSGTPPLFTLILAAIYLGEKLRLKHFVSLAMAFVGMIMLSGNVETSAGADLESWKVWVGTFVTLIPQFSWAVYSLVGQKVIKKYSWKTLCRGSFAVGAAMLFIPALIEIYYKGFGTWTPQSFGLFAYLALLNSVATYSLWNSALQYISISFASFLLYLQPLAGVLVAWLAFGERLGTVGMSGAVLVIAALVIVNKKE